jgi:hypothetical protein
MLRLKAGKKASKRNYPKKYERSVPWILGIIGFFILALLAAIVLVIAGVFPLQA